MFTAASRTTCTAPSSSRRSSSRSRPASSSCRPSARSGWAGSGCSAPMLFALAVIFNFACGGVTGIFLADVPTDIHLQDTYFVVAHFHYTIVGGEIFAPLRRHLLLVPEDDRPHVQREARASSTSGGCSSASTSRSSPCTAPGIKGMNRRIADYPDSLEPRQPHRQPLRLRHSARASSSSSTTWSTRGCAAPLAEANPWQARTLEWQTSSPPPLENFPTPPVVTGHPYDYGVPGSVHGVFPGAQAAGGLLNAPAGGGK